MLVEHGALLLGEQLAQRTIPRHGGLHRVAVPSAAFSDPEQTKPPGIALTSPKSARSAAPRAARPARRAGSSTTVSSPLPWTRRPRTTTPALLRARLEGSQQQHLPDLAPRVGRSPVIVRTAAAPVRRHLVSLSSTLSAPPISPRSSLRRSSNVGRAGAWPRHHSFPGPGAVITCSLTVAAPAPGPGIWDTSGRDGRSTAARSPRFDAVLARAGGGRPDGRWRPGGWRRSMPCARRSRGRRARGDGADGLARRGSRGGPAPLAAAGAQTRPGSPEHQPRARPARVELLVEAAVAAARYVMLEWDPAQRLEGVAPSTTRPATSGALTGRGGRCVNDLQRRRRPIRARRAGGGRGGPRVAGPARWRSAAGSRAPRGARGLRVPPGRGWHDLLKPPRPLMTRAIGPRCVRSCA